MGMLNSASLFSSQSKTYIPNSDSKSEKAIEIKTLVRENERFIGIAADNQNLTDYALPVINQLAIGDSQVPILNDLYQKILGNDAGDYSEQNLLLGIHQALLDEIDKSLLVASEIGQEDISLENNYIWRSDYSVSNTYLALIKMSVVMAETNQALVDMQKSLIAVNSDLLKALNAKGEAQTKKLDDIHKHLQHVLNKIKRLGVLGKLAVGLVSLASELAGCASAIATGNLASFGANALAAYNSTAQVAAGTLLLTMDEANKLLNSSMGFEVNIGESFLEDVQTSGFFFFAGDAAGAVISEVITTAALTSGVLAELNMAVQMVRTATQTSVEVSVKIAQRLLLNFVTVAGDAVGLGFHYQAMVDSLRHKNTASNEVDAKTITANFGASMGLLTFILEETSALDELATVLGDTGMGKDCGKMLAGYMLMLTMGLLKSRISYGQYQDKEALDALAVQSTPSSLANKYQGTAIPPRLLASMDATIIKVSDSFNKVAGDGITNHNMIRFIGYCITLLMFNMQMSNVIESCDSSLGSVTMEKGKLETGVSKDMYDAQERLYQSLISSNNDMNQQTSQVVFENLDLLNRFYATLGRSILNHTVINE